MSRPRSRKRAYCLHKSSGRAYVTLDGKPVYLGHHGSPESVDAYDALMGEWIARGRQSAVPDEAAESASSALGTGLTITELVAAFITWARDYYSEPVIAADGSPELDDAGNPRRKPAGAYVNHTLALRPLVRLYGSTPAKEFGPLKLESLRSEALKPYGQTGIDPRTKKPRVIKCRGWSRRVANQNISRIRSAFKWAVSREMIPATVYSALLTMGPLEKGKGGARELPKVKPANQADVDRVLMLLPPTVAAMVQVEAITGMRPSEVCAMRGADIDRSNRARWTYTPTRHKTLAHDIERVIYLGPKCQKILTPMLRVGFIFSPRDPDTWRREQAAKSRTSEPTRKQLAAREENAKRHRFADHYTAQTYYRSIRYACKAAGLDQHWGPNRLRHLAATNIRKSHGLPGRHRC